MSVTGRSRSTRASGTRTAFGAREVPTPEARAASFRKITKGKRPNNRGANHWANKATGGDPRRLVLIENGRKSAATINTRRKLEKIARRNEACGRYYLRGESVEAIAKVMGLRARTVKHYINTRLTAEAFRRLRAMTLR